MSIYNVIKDDHRKVEKLFDELQGLTDPDARYDCFDRLKEELLAHAKAEEKVFYRRLKKGDFAERIEHAEEEHHDFEAMLAIIQDLEPNHRSYPRKVKDLRDMVMHHIREEEADILPKGKKVLGPDTDNRIATEFLRQKAKLQERGLEPTG